MKTLLSTFVFFILCFSCRKPVTNTSVNLPTFPFVNDTAGNVLYLTYTSDTAILANGTKSVSARWSTYSFTAGRIMQITDSFFDGSNKYRDDTTTFLYDAQGKLIQKKSANGQLTNLFVYDVLGRLIETHFKYPTTPEGIYYYTYNSSNQVDSSVIYATDITIKRKYSYDNNGNLRQVETMNYSVSGAPIGAKTITQYGYDNKPNPFFTICSNAFTLPQLTVTPNNVLSITYLDAAGNVLGNSRSFTYSYNGYGLPISRNDTLKYRYR